MKINKIELKPCPHCGKNVAEVTNVKDIEECGKFESTDCPCFSFEPDPDCYMKTVVCCVNKGGCGASSGWKESEEEAIKAWNTRYIDNFGRFMNEPKEDA